jgi:hypothetical protein
VGRLWARLTCGTGAELLEEENSGDGDVSGIVTDAPVAIERVDVDVVEKCGVVVSVTSSKGEAEELSSDIPTALEE